MKEQVAVLYGLQTIDIKISDIQGRLSAMDGAKAYRRKYGVAKAAYEAAAKELQDNETELKDNELKLRTIDEKRGGHEKRLYSGAIVNPKELSAVEKEIQSLKAQQGELDGRVLELYEAVENFRANAAAGKQIMDEAERIARAAMKKESAEKTGLEAELAELTSKRESIVAQVADARLMSRYEASRKRTGSTGVAKVIDGRCEGCHVSITAFIMRNLYSTDELQLCENCSRLLMLEL